VVFKGIFMLIYTWKVLSSSTAQRQITLLTGEKKTYIKAWIKLGEGSEINVGTFMFCIKLQASIEASAVILWVIHLFYALKSVSCLIKNFFRGVKPGQRCVCVCVCLKFPGDSNVQPEWRNTVYKEVRRQRRDYIEFLRKNKALTPALPVPFFLTILFYPLSSTI